VRQRSRSKAMDANIQGDLHRLTHAELNKSLRLSACVPARMSRKFMQARTCTQFSHAAESSRIQSDRCIKFACMPIPLPSSSFLLCVHHETVCPSKPVSQCQGLYSPPSMFSLSNRVVACMVESRHTAVLSSTCPPR